MGGPTHPDREVGLLVPLEGDALFNGRPAELVKDCAHRQTAT